MRQLLGELIASGEAHGRQMDRIEQTMNSLAEAQSETRIMVFEDRATVRALKWSVAVAMAAIAWLGLDWWQR